MVMPDSLLTTPSMPVAAAPPPTPKGTPAELLALKREMLQNGVHPS
jgi:hypothetical protein